MAVNLVVASGTVMKPALRFDSNAKAEYRFTLDQQDGDFHLWLPCCASGSAAERLHEQLDEGMRIIITSGRLCYRKRQTQKSGEVSRLEVSVWQVDRLSESSGPAQADTGEPNSTSDEVACNRGMFRIRVISGHKNIAKDFGVGKTIACTVIQVCFRS
jgi:single-stranded DNA-binding protein